MMDWRLATRTGPWPHAAWIGLALTVATIVPRGAAKAQQPARPTPAVPNSVLLLHNGRTIEGRVSRAGDYYYVALSRGQIRVRAEQVELWCSDLEDGYRRKRAAIRPGVVEDHLRLARWCLRQRLFDHAAAELDDARQAAPTHPMIGLLRRQLATVQSPPARQPAPPATAAPAIRQEQEDVPTPEALQAMVDRLPPEAVETFTRRIQPLLLNVCGSASCHGPGGESEFRLRRIPLDRPPTRLTTQRNLHAALRWVDRSHPASSALLTDPAEAHGPAKTPVFSKPETPQYQRLVDWVHQVAGTQAEEGAPAEAVAQDGPASTEVVPADATAPTVPGLLDEPPGARPMDMAEATGDGESAASAGQAVPAGYEEPLSGSGPAAGEALTAESPQPRGRIQRGAKIEGFVPQDPFDPEIFNRRYFK